MVEGRDAVDLGRRDGEALGQVVGRTTADPPDRVLERVQCRQQEVPAFALELPAADHPRAVGLCRPEDALDRLPFEVGGGGAAEVDVHSGQARSGRSARSTRTAVALNSAVPDLGS